VTVTGTQAGGGTTEVGTTVAVYVIVGGHFELEVDVTVLVVIGQVGQGTVVVIVVTVITLTGTQHLSTGDHTFSEPNRLEQQRSGFIASPQLEATTHLLS